jgi:prolyl oligopeptidase
MKCVVWCLCLALAGCSSQNRVARTSARPPETRAAPVTESVHGASVVDNYRWLEGDTPEVAAWISAENSYTRAVLDRLPGRQVLEDRFAALMRMGSVTPPIMRANRYFFSRATAAQSQPLVYWRDGYAGADRTLLDPQRLDPARPTAVAWLSPSSDGRLLAYGTYHTGDSNPTLHLLEVDTANVLPLEIPNVPDEVQWLPDGTGFFYHREDEKGRRGLLHRMSGSAKADVVVYHQAAPASMQSLPDNWGPFGTLSADGHWIVLGHWEDPTSNDLWLASFDDFRKTGKLVARVVSVGAAGQASGTVVGGTLFLQTTKGAPQGRVVAVSAADPSQARWRDVVKERPDAVITSVSFASDRIAVTYRKSAADFIEVFDLTGKSQGTLKLPGIGVTSLTGAADRTEAFLTFTSINYPPTVFRVDLANPAAAPQLWMAPEMAGQPSDVQVEQVWYPSKDGTQISMFVAHRSGLARRANAPALLLGFGAFGVSVTPSFSSTFFQWFDAGGLVAVPNVRGGGEYGPAWHAAGMLDKKQTSFDDFIAAAEWLIGSKYTNPQRLAVYGGSHGGLLAGALLTQRPDLCRVVVLNVPLLDMLRYDGFPAGREWVQEYGSARDPAQSKWLLAYSPYQHIKAGTKYPGVLLMTDDADADVHAMHARKMTAALRAATASDPGDHPILLRADRVAGPDPQAALHLQLQNVVDQRIFIMWQLGLL